MPFLSILLSLAMTICIETYIYLLLKWRDLKLLAIVTLMNLILNTSMNIILIYCGNNQFTYWLILSIYEVSTIFIESLIIYLFMRFKYFKILLIALAANISSFLVGLALSPLFEYQIAAIILTIVFFLGYLAVYFICISFNISKHKE